MKWNEILLPRSQRVDSRTQGKVSKWIQLLHKHPAHLHALDVKDAQPHRDPGIKHLAGMTMSKLTDKYTIKRNKIRNQITLLRGQADLGMKITVDKRRTTTTNRSSSHHHDSAPSRPHSLICTGADPIHPVHASSQLGRAVAPRNEVIFLPFWRGLFHVN